MNKMSKLGLCHQLSAKFDGLGQIKPGYRELQWERCPAYYLRFLDETFKSEKAALWSRSGPTLPAEFTSQMEAALSIHGLSLPPSPSPLTNAEAAQFTKHPWALLSPTRWGDVLTFKPHPTINANTFGFDEFTKLSQKFTNPDPSTGPSSILILACTSCLHSKYSFFIC
jgi:hypothetical protein